MTTPATRICEKCFLFMPQKRRPQTCPGCGHTHEKNTTTNTLTVGNTYRVASTRKGKFTGKLVRHDDTWATFEITQGRAGAMLQENVRKKGEEVTVRREWCTFTEAPT